MLAAPCAPSMTTRSPSRWLGSTRSRCAMYRVWPSRIVTTRPTSAPIGRVHRSPIAGLDAVLDLVGQLVPAAGEELDAVVGHRVVRRREHDAEVGAGVGGEVGDGRRRQHAHVVDVDTRPRPAPRRRPADRNSPDARGSRPTTALGRWPASAPTCPSTRAAATETDRASSAVMTGPFARPRTPSVPKSRDMGCLSVRMPESNLLPDAPKAAPRGCRLRRGPGIRRMPWGRDQRLLYWGALRAFLRPAFLRSGTRASRERKPAFFSAGRLSSGSTPLSERATPRRTAPA